MNLTNIIAERKSKTIYRDDDKAIKVFNEDYSKAEVLNEALNTARVEVTGLPIPRIIEVTKIEEKWSIISQFIEGESLYSLMKKNPDKLDEYLNMFVDLQLLVQSKECPMLNKLRDKMQGKISQCGLDATTRYELHTRLDSMPKHKKLCHGDFTPGNVIVGPDGKLSIIDWAHATQGNASADAARTFLRFSLAGMSDTADKYLDLFCKKSDTPRQYVQRWFPIVAASQLVKGNPEEKEFLERWACVCDYE